MDAGEGLIEARAVGTGAGGLELGIRLVSDRTCFVALPSFVLTPLMAANPRLPLPLVLTLRGGRGGRGLGGPGVTPHAGAGGNGGIIPAGGQQTSPLFAAWAGAAARSHDCVEVPLAVADCLGLREGDVVRVSGRPMAPVASTVVVVPDSAEDWEAVMAAAEEVERQLLTQCGVVAEGQTFPFWPSRGAAGGKPLRLRATGVTPHAPGSVARLGLETELHIAPWVPAPPPMPPQPLVPSENPPVASRAGPSEDAGGASTGEAGGAERGRKPGRVTAGAISTSTSVLASSLPLPVVLRVQDTRGVVVAWARRVPVDATADASSPTAVAAPTTCAFVSRATAADRGLREGSLVRVAAVSATPSGAGTREGRSEEGASGESIARAAVLRLVLVKASGGRVGDGHVVLTPALRDRLGVVQGSRVVLAPVAPPPRGGVPPLLRLRPAVTAEAAADVAAPHSPVGPVAALPAAGEPRGGLSGRGGGMGSSSGADVAAGQNATCPPSVGATLRRPHRLALGLKPCPAHATAGPPSPTARGTTERWDHTSSPASPNPDAAAQRLLARWVATQARFVDLEDRDGFIPVTTGTVLHFKLEEETLQALPGDESGADEAMSDQTSRDTTTTAAFELDVQTPGGIALLSPTQFHGEEEDDNRKGDTDPAVDPPRVELGPDLVRVPFDPGIVSKLYGRAVTVDPPFINPGTVIDGDALDPAAPPGSAAAAAADAALQRLTLALSPRAAAHRAATSPHLQPPGGVLLWGVPGSGRSAVARAVARRLRNDPNVLASIVAVDCGGIQAGDPRAAIAALRAATAAAVKRAPALVVIDDLDAIAGGAEGVEAGGRPSSGEIVGEALADIVDAASASLPGVAFLATAGKAEGVHGALRAAGRLDHVAELRPPERVEGREALMAATAAERGTPIAPGAGRAAANAAEGFGTGDLRMLVERAAHAAARRVMTTWQPRGVGPRVPSRSAVFVEDATSRAARLVPGDFEAAREGFVPAPMRALGGAGSADSADPSVAEDALLSVGGLSGVKAALDEALALPLRHAALFANAPLRLRSGVLLYGPPGCGKTMVAKAAVAAAGVRMISVKGPELLNKYIGQSEAGVRDVFRRAAAAAPSALFFDEFDAIAPRRGHDSTGVTDRVVNQFLTELDGVEGLQGVTVLAATSRPDLIDPALLRPGRLDRLLLCPFPDEHERREILTAHAARLPSFGGAPESSRLGLDQVAARTAGFSGADLRALLSDASLAAIRREIARGEGGGGEGAVVVTREDVMGALEAAVASVPKDERDRLGAVYAVFETGRRSGGGGGEGQGRTPGRKKVSHA